MLSGLNRQVSTIIAFILFVVARTLCLLQIGGKSIPQLFHSYPTPITPIDYTFYAMTLHIAFYLALVVYQAQRRRTQDEELDRVCTLLCVNFICYAAMVVCMWQSQLFGAEVLTIVDTLIVTRVYTLLNVGRVTVSPMCKFCIHISANWWDVDAEFGIALVLVAVLSAAYILLIRADIAYGISTLWILYGISENDTAQHDSKVSTACYIFIGLLFVVGIFGIIYEKTYQKYDDLGVKKPIFSRASDAPERVSLLA